MLKKLLLLEMVVPTLLCMSSYLSILLVEYAHDLHGYFRFMRDRLVNNIRISTYDDVVALQ